VEPSTEFGLLTCFGVEPHLLDADIPWCYNTATYNVEVDGLAVSFAVQPAYCQVRLEVRRAGQRLFAVAADWVAELRVIDESGVDAVEVEFGAGAWLRLQLRPAFEITQGFASEAEPGAAADGGA